MTATYARCTEPTAKMTQYDNAEMIESIGCGWTGEVERVDEKCPGCDGRGYVLGREFYHDCRHCSGTGKVTHDGEGRWPWDIDKCPNCSGRIELA